MIYLVLLLSNERLSVILQLEEKKKHWFGADENANTYVLYLYMLAELYLCFGVDGDHISDERWKWKFEQLVVGLNTS